MEWFASVLLLSIGLAQSSGLPVVSERLWAKPDHFWWRRSVPGGHVWLTVDAKHGAKAPLFDHQRLAIELNLRSGYEFTPLTLPFADPALRFVVKYRRSNAYIQEDAMAIEFVLDGHQWRCELQIKWDWNKVPPTDYECLARRPAPVALTPLPAAGTAANPLVIAGSQARSLRRKQQRRRSSRRRRLLAKMLISDGTTGDQAESLVTPELSTSDLCQNCRGNQ